MSKFEVDLEELKALPLKRWRKKYLPLQDGAGLELSSAAEDRSFLLAELYIILWVPEVNNLIQIYYDELEDKSKYGEKTRDFFSGPSYLGRQWINIAFLRTDVVDSLPRDDRYDFVNACNASYTPGERVKPLGYTHVFKERVVEFLKHYSSLVSGSKDRYEFYKDRDFDNIYPSINDVTALAINLTILGFLAGVESSEVVETVRKKCASSDFPPRYGANFLDWKALERALSKAAVPKLGER